jgi:two-component system, chemotaxis family, chemotaxis protein CheY
MDTVSNNRRSILSDVMAWAMRCLTLLHLKTAWEKGKAPEEELAAKVETPENEKLIEEEIFHPQPSMATAFDPSKVVIKVIGSPSKKNQKGVAQPVPGKPVTDSLHGNGIQDMLVSQEANPQDLFPLPPIQAAKPCILIIDDYPPLLNMLAMAIKGAEYDVCTAKDGLEGLIRLHENQVDLVVSDVQMPKIDGFDLRRMLNVRESTRELPMIYLTEVLDEQTKAIARRLGVSNVLVKPFTLDCLLECIRSCVAVRSLENSTQIKADTTLEAAPTV